VLGVLLLRKRALLLLGELRCACVSCFERALLQLLELLRLLLELLLGVRCVAQFTCFTGTQFACFTSCCEWCVSLLALLAACGALRCSVYLLY
jgi:hypothetical protein